MTQDDTQYLQGLIDSSADIVAIEYKGRPYVTKPLHLRTGLNLVLRPGVVLEAMPGEFKDPHDSLLFIEEVENVSIVGHGATLRMRREDYTTKDYEQGEWRHGICLKGADGIEIQGLRIEDTGGDGIYVGPTWDDRRIGCEDIFVGDCKLDQNHRQGISVVSATRATIANCRITGTKGTAPQAGIDLEPSHPLHHMVGILVRHCVAEGNDGSGFVVNLPVLSEESQPVSIRIENCLVRECVAAGLRVVLLEGHGTGSVVYANCTVEGTKWPGLSAIWNMATGVNLTFEDCSWSDVAYGDGHFPLSFELSSSGEEKSIIELKNARVFNAPVGQDVLEVKGLWPDGLQGNYQVSSPVSEAASRLKNLSVSYVGNG